MEVVLQTYYILLPIIATGFIGWIGVSLKDQRKKEELREKEALKKQKEADLTRKANSEGIKLILRYMLKRYHTEYTIQRKITYDQHKEWVDIYTAYKALNGNSIAEDWNNDIESLPKCNSVDGHTVFETLLHQGLNQLK